ncbi:MAG: holo-ACP synthase [Cyclobacteriaceae bacterium]|nr:holo-ACP synthase [Cyclobacteriaceae bacterium]
MIAGTGVDIVEVARLTKSLERPGFLEKVFSIDEINYCHSKAKPPEHFAGRFAAKEALAKAVGDGWYGQVDINKIEVINDDKGKPEYRWGPEVLARYPQLATLKIHLSISHCHSYAVAMAVLEKI